MSDSGVFKIPANAARSATSKSVLPCKVPEFIPDRVIVTNEVLFTLLVGSGVGSNVGVSPLYVGDSVGNNVGETEGNGVGLLIGVDVGCRV